MVEVRLFSISVGSVLSVVLIPAIALLIMLLSLYSSLSVASCIVALTSSRISLQSQVSR